MKTAIDAIQAVKTAEEQRRLHRGYLEAIQPIIRQKVRILCVCMPTYWRYPDGRMEKKDDGLTPDLQTCMDQLDEMIRQVATNYGFTPPALDTRAQAAINPIA